MVGDTPLPKALTDLMLQDGLLALSVWTEGGSFLKDDAGVLNLFSDEVELSMDIDATDTSDFCDLLRKVEKYSQCKVLLDMVIKTFQKIYYLFC